MTEGSSRSDKVIVYAAKVRPASFVKMFDRQLDALYCRIYIKRTKARMLDLREKCPRFCFAAKEV
ncbi:hypothetical protein B5F86_02120 [Lachnoclostridium sp. An298]|nr:hypothetical protein B5F86_02120 [Lachnoclostridium sp. An298]